MAEKFMVECGHWRHDEPVYADSIKDAVDAAEEMLRDLEEDYSEGVDNPVTIYLMVPVRTVEVVTEFAVNTTEIPFSLGMIAGCMK